MNLDQLNGIANAMVADNKGLLAADESTATIAKRLATINVESTEENRRNYRELLFCSKDIGKYISGTILFDETLRQKTRDDIPFTELLRSKGVIPGIKVDKGAKPLPGSEGETITEGLDGLPARVSEYVALGAQFAKWRAVIRIGDGLPTKFCINSNAHALASYAKICQEGGLVPIVEPEVLMDGNHSIELCQEVTENVLRSTFHELYNYGVECEGIVLKPNMVIPGQDCLESADIEDVASRTIATLRRSVPAAVPGIMFLSGGQSEELATEHLNAMNANYPGQPWKLSFSYGRALQQSALSAWKGDDKNILTAQGAFLKRARENSLACCGKSTLNGN